MRSGVFIVLCALLLAIAGCSSEVEKIEFSEPELTLLDGGISLLESKSVEVVEEAIEVVAEEVVEQDYSDADLGEHNENRGGTAVKEFVIIAKDDSFEPDLLKVNEGEFVRITVKSMDKVYGFSLPEFGVEEIVNPGYPHQFIFKADRDGVFDFESHIYSGVNTAQMEGVLVVE